MEKITKKQALNHIMEVVGEDDEIVANYVKHELELLNKKNKVDDEKVKLNASLVDKLLAEVMTKGETYTATMLATALEVSTQKVTPILTKLVNDGLLTKTIEKRVSLYALA